MDNSQFIQLDTADKIRKLNDFLSKKDKLTDELQAVKDIFPDLNIKD